MSTRMTLPMAAMPTTIAESVAAVLNVYGLALSPDLLREIGNNTTQALYSLDESTDSAERPAIAELLAVGETLRALAAAGRPNADTAAALARVGQWLVDTAKADMAKAPRAA